VELSRRRSVTGTCCHVGYVPGRALIQRHLGLWRPSVGPRPNGDHRCYMASRCCRRVGEPPRNASTPYQQWLGTVAAEDANMHCVGELIGVEVGSWDGVAGRLQDTRSGSETSDGELQPAADRHGGAGGRRRFGGLVRTDRPQLPSGLRWRGGRSAKERSRSGDLGCSG
jgi:hypothetical protein